MFARVTPYRLKPGTIDAATERAQSLKERIMGMRGTKEFIDVVDADGNGCIISIVETEEVSDANADKVKAIWSDMSEFLAEQPRPTGHEVKMHWHG